MYTLQTKLGEEFDEKCKDIISYLVIKYALEENKLRYNAMFREITQVFKMSKPTFNEHIQHLINKKLICRLEENKQEVYLFLNDNNPMIKTSKEAIKSLDRDAEILRKQIGKPIFWSEIVLVFSYYFSICELKRMRALIQYHLSPNKTRENLLAVHIQTLYEDRIGAELQTAIDKFGPTSEKERMVLQMISSLDNAIKQTEKSLSEVDKENVSKKEEKSASKEYAEETEQRKLDLERIAKLKAKPQIYDSKQVKEVKEYLKTVEKLKKTKW